MAAKETLEALAAAEAVCDALIKAAGDGKLTLIDLRHAVEPAKKIQAGIDGLDKVLGEIKDLFVNGQDAVANQVIEKAIAVSSKAMEALALLAKAKVSFFMPMPDVDGEAVKETPAV